MEELLRELRALGIRVDDETAMGFLQLHLEEDEDEDESGSKNPLLLNLDLDEEFIELYGKGFWALEPHLREKTRDFASRLILRFLQGTFGATRKLSTYISKPVQQSETFLELDIESTLESKIDNPLSQTIPWSFQRKTSRNPVVLLVDTSYSMSGHKVVIAGTVAATLSHLVPIPDLCIVGFARRPYDIKRFDEDIASYYLVARVLRLAPQSYTNLSLALARGRKLISDFPNTARLVLLSDCEPTMGKNPFVEASKLPTLDVLLFPGGNAWVAKRLTLEARQGRLLEISKINLIPQALQELFS